MRNYFIGSILGMVMVLAVTPLVRAQSGKGAPDLTGVWDNEAGPNSPGAGITGPGFAFGAVGRGGIPRNTFFTKNDPQPSMQPWALEKFKANSGAIGIKDGISADPSALDPRMSCFPPSPTQFFTIPQPFEIQQLPKQVLLLFEYDHWVRRIHMDEREHPDGYPITWMGHSTGKYDGDSLVVDTVGINDLTWLDGIGHPHTTAMHIVERFRRVDHDTLEIQFLFDDPKAYTKPWTGKKIFQFMPPNYQIMEHINCEDYLELGKHR